jgi:hypothetical protein
VKPDRYEAIVNRVTINKGLAKGRAVLASAGDGIAWRWTGRETIRPRSSAASMAALT